MRFNIHTAALVSVSLGMLSACSTPATPTLAPSGGGVATGSQSAFAVPMDPGQIRCGDLVNPAALAEAVQWTLGRARAAVVAGRLANAPNQEAMAQVLSAQCGASPSTSIAAVARQLGY